MGEQFSVLLNQMAMFTTLIIIGFAAQRTKLISDEAIDHISKFTTRLLLPSMVLTNIPSGSKEELFQMLPFLMCGIIMILIMFGIGLLSGNLLKMKQPTKNIHTAMIMFPNTGFIGFPLLLAMYPTEGPVVIAVYIILDSIVMWSLCPILANPEQSTGHINLLAAVNPVTVFTVIGLAMLIIGIAPHNIAWTTLTEVGSTSKYFALIYIGADIGRKGFKKLFSRLSVLWTVPIRLIIVPVVVFLVLRMIPFLTHTQLMMLTTIAMLPTGVVISMLAKSYGSDDGYASAGTLLTTLFSMGTMPLVTWALSQF